MLFLNLYGAKNKVPTSFNMNKQLNKMKKLAWKIARERKKERDVVAILLFGSVAKRTPHPESDIDLVLIKDSQENSIEREQVVEEKIKIDLWKHSSSFYEQLFEKNWSPEKMFQYSLFLNILQECEILYDKDSRFNRYKKDALKWKWSTKCK
ncbi:MAG: nucleotidyltransferase domain-containing protein [Candidatus Bathyarchaeota archaeon]|nr:MAG: nucleotidyltransferase domain-containing protein [Candidatus Bathyarchaeota archaeon]